MAANPSYLPLVAGSELSFPGPGDPTFRLDRVPGRRSHELSVAGVLDEDSADHLSALLHRLAGLRVVSVSYPVLDVFAALGVTWSAEQGVFQWACLDDRVVALAHT